ncbi:hypothetical protein J0J30_22910, partial [Vibrio vulnificus]|nr:hypothetical protein [Vibrio vulnificus]
MWDRNNLNVEFWLGRGKPQHPYLYGRLVEHLRQVLKPKEIRIVPEEYFQQSGMRDFKEWSLMKGWMKSWLK